MSYSDQAHQHLAPRALSPEAVVAIPVAGGIVLIAAIAVLVLLVKARAEHKRLLADLERRGISVSQTQVHDVGDGTMTRPRAVLRRNTLMPYSTTGAWGSLYSNENIGGEATATANSSTSTVGEDAKEEERSNRRPWRFSKKTPRPGPRPLKIIRHTHLSAIMESPRSLAQTPSPRLPPAQRPDDAAPTSHAPTIWRVASSDQMTEVASNNGDTSSCPPFKPSDFFRELDDRENPRKRPRSRLRKNRTATITGSSSPIPATAPNTDPGPRSRKCTRSISLHSQRAGVAPTQPAPPLPLNVNRSPSQNQKSTARSPSRLSETSLESASSSILVPALSPLVPRDPSFQIRGGANREWTKSLIVGPRPMCSNANGSSYLQSTYSIRSNIAQFSRENSFNTAQHSRDGSNSSTTSDPKRLSAVIPEAAEAIRSNRIAPRSIMEGDGGIQRIATPRRQSRSQVTTSGSPTQRRKTSVLRDVSGNSVLPARQSSQSSGYASSRRSSNGNPFQWDPSPLRTGKPSALKGSPNARKGHKRQNCVRISLAPTILNKSRSPTPSMIFNIVEEGRDMASQNESSRQPDPSKGRRASMPRPPSTSIFAPEVRLQPTMLRASLATSSPSLSLTNYHQDSCGSFPFPSPATSNAKRSSSRLSGSSTFTIPSFPSPVRSSSNNLLQLRDLSAPNLQLTEASPATSISISRSDTKADSKTADGANVYTSTDCKPVEGYDPENLSIDSPALRSKKRRTPPQSVRDWEQAEDVDSPPCSPKTLRAPVIKSSSYDSLRFLTSAIVFNDPVPALPAPPKPASRTLPGGEEKEARGRTTVPNSILGPRALPPPDLRKTIAQLRRMNSTATVSSRSDRRYMNLGREASPSLPNLCFPSPEITPGADPDQSEIWDDNTNVSIREAEFDDNEKVDDPVDQLVEALCGLHEDHHDGGKENMPTPDLTTDSGFKLDLDLPKRSSSVWEDGESFWSSPNRAIPSQDFPLREIAPLRPKRVASLLMENAPVLTPKQRGMPLEGRSGEIGVGYGSGVGLTVTSSPRSLYDENGFLKT